MLRRLTTWLAAAAISILPNAAGGTDALPTLPQAPKVPVVDTYWGQPVADDYQYMEKPDSAVETWVKEENAYTRAWMDRHPDRKAILDRVVQLTHSSSTKYYSMDFKGGAYFVMKEQPPKQQPFLVALTSILDRSTERVVVDPNALDPSGATSIDFYVSSRDGKRVAVSLSKSGTEDGTLHLYDTATGRALPDVIPGVNGGTAGGSAAWTADGTGIYYTRYPQKGERPDEDLAFYQQVYYHKLGSPISEDIYVVGKEFPRIAEIQLITSEDGRWVLADVSNGDGGEHGYWLRGQGGAWKRFADFSDGIIEVEVGLDDAAYLLSRADAPNRKILRLPLDTPELALAKVVVPETEHAIEYYTPTATRLYVTEMVGGPTQMRVYDLAGKPLDAVTMPEIATVGQAIRVTGDDVVVRSQSYTRPPAYYRYGPNSKGFLPTALVQTSAADFSGCEVRREFATAKDGTKLPVNIIMRRGTKLDGNAPTLLYGYGSYGISENPRFDADLMAWIEQGGIFVDASIRGGGEYGEPWHQQARLGTKKVSMDDFAACARYLVEKGYTRKERLAIEGGSAGGLLVYGTMVHYPNEMHAVVAHVGYGDVLRTELAPNGQFNVTEFGTVTDSSQFRGMYGYSPYHHVKDGTVYPSVLALTGVNDPRVPAWETYKMVARLQATGSPNPVLMRVTYDAGHGIGSSLKQRDERAADVWLFLLDRLGMKYRPVASGGAPGEPPPNP